MPGLDKLLIARLNKDIAFARIGKDMRNDFIISPHYAAIFKHASNDLWALLTKKLTSGTFEFSLPLSIEVVKKSGLSRLGSILPPLDRLLYQSVADAIAHEAVELIDHSKVFSNKLNTNEPETGRMFESPHSSYSTLKEKINELCNRKEYSHVIVADIASYFDRIYQHVLINLLYSTTDDTGYISILEKALSSWSSKDSHGIIQGVYPSDLFGNVYLSSFDTYLKINDIEFVRYVDDYWMFFSSKKDAQAALINICNFVRREGLYFNESKTKILETRQVYHEENEIDQLFDQVRAEKEEKTESLHSFDYFDPFEIIEVFSKDEEDSEIESLIELYQKRYDNPSLIERIDKFCLPVFSQLGNSIAVSDALDGISKRPHLTNVYCQYLRAVGSNDDSIFSDIESFITGNSVAYEWQLMWLLALMYNSDHHSEAIVSLSLRVLTENRVSPAVRAVAALIVAKFGSGSCRRILRTHYATEQSPYVREAIMYSTKYFPSPSDRKTCRALWSTHSDTNELIAIALNNEP